MWVIVPIVFAAILFWVLLTRARLARLRRRAELLWQEISTQFERRWNLVPELVTAFRAVVPERESLFAQTLSARDAAMNAETLSDHAEAETELKNSMFHLFALSFEYEELATDPRVLATQRALEEAEDAIQKARGKYNDIVYDLNRSIASFPRSVVASFSGFSPLEYYGVSKEEMEPGQVMSP